MICAATAARRYPKLLAQFIKIVSTARRRLADLFVGDSFADTYVHVAIQTQMRMIVN